MVHFFIDRPIFAWVIAIIIMLGGLLAVKNLPVSQYPELAPPAVRVSTFYPGASAETVEVSVVQIIEQNLTGLDNMLYMKSESSSTGRVSIIVTFAPGTDPDIAQVQVQNKLQKALALLPQEVQSEGVQVTKASQIFLMVVALISPDNSRDNYDLADFMHSTLREPIARVQGVGDVMVFGAPYSMRIWLDPHKLNSYQMTPVDVRQSVAAQNRQVAVGALGGAPSAPGQQQSFTLMAQSMFRSPEQFEQIVLKVNPDGSKVLLKDVARVELGAEDYNFQGHSNGRKSAGMAIMLGTGENALATSNRVRAKIDEMLPYFPSGIEPIFPYDTTLFIKISIEEVTHTLIEAIILVVLVMYLFMQNFRATLIPAITVPIVLLGTFGIMSVAGFSINTLTMFGLVLAIGLLVDDAIVVVENVERIMREEGLPPREATRKSMDQITGALIGIGLVLSAVFVPMAFFGGSTGEIYRQFAVTIVSAMTLSVIVALTLTPALCASMLKPMAKGEHEQKRGFFGWFNRKFEKTTNAYHNGVRHVLQHTGRLGMTYAVIIALVVLFFKILPTGFIPEEDQGVLLTMVQLPVGATMERTQETLDMIQEYYATQEKDVVKSVFTLVGYSLAGQGQNMGMCFIDLKDWGEREDEGQDVWSVIERASAHFAKVKGANIFAFNVPAVPELGNATGFELYLQDRGQLGHVKLTEAMYQLLAMAAEDPNLIKVRPNAMPDAPQYNIKVDYEKALAQGIGVNEINNTLAIAWGASYINDFIDRNRIKKVYIQADAPYRMNEEDLDLWYIRNNRGDMVPFSTFTSGFWNYTVPRLERFNGYPAFNIVGEPAPGRASGEAMESIAALIDKLPFGISYGWYGTSFQEQQAGAQAPFLYAISALVVFLCLAALYESWTVPFAVILSVPVGVLGALAAVYFRGLINDVYFQVGLLTTMGLAAKNAILIVEFAKRRHDKGRELIDCAVRAARLRFRPILMTSLAFIFGVLPLALSTGAGVNARHAIGTSVVGGMLAATVLAIFLIPYCFVLVVRIFDKNERKLARQKRLENRGGVQ
ncbi:MAG: efflux RND transporter permease subunit [Desulfobulbus sp.]|jgi:multidrug efflux pump